MIQSLSLWIVSLCVFFISGADDALGRGNSPDQVWMYAIEGQAQTCRDQAMSTPTPGSLDKSGIFDQCFDEVAIAADAKTQCFNRRYAINSSGCSLRPDELQCHEQTREATMAACEVAVDAEVTSSRARHMEDLRAVSVIPRMRPDRVDCSLPENELHEDCGAAVTSTPTEDNCEDAMAGELAGSGDGFVLICVATGRPPVRATEAQCAMLETPEAQSNCRTHFEGIAAAERERFDPLDTNRDGVVSAEERRTADEDNDGRVSEAERERAEERQAANPEQISACDAAFAQASLCCNNPMACLVGGNDETVGNNVQAGIGLVMQGGQMYSGMQQQNAQMNGEPSTAMCDFMNTAGTAGAGINAASAAVCMQKKSACNRTCEGVSTGKCDHFNANVAQSAIQGLSMGLAASIANQCANMAAQSNGLQPSDIEFLPDCSDPANSSNPNCNGECSGPDAASNPFCKTGGGGGNGGAGTSYAMHEASYGDNNANYDSNPDLLDGVGMQENIGFGAEGQAQANAIQGGGGGGMGTGAGGANLGGDGKGKAQGGGYNTNVLKGASGGGGYVGPSTGSVGVNSGGGGFRGYGRARGGGGDDTIDLKQFLPGGKKDTRKRTVAGLAGPAAAQIGRKETNIFQTMSVKYRQMCKLKRMWDCPKLSAGASRSR